MATGIAAGIRPVEVDVPPTAADDVRSVVVTPQMAGTACAWLRNVGKGS